MFFYVFFFFKQKTAYEMRISDWSSDVCSSDLANAEALDIGEYEVLPVVKEIPVVCGVHGSDPRRRMWHHLLKVKDMGFSGVNNFPTHSIVDGHFRQVLEETGMGFRKEVEMVELATKMDLFSIVFVATAEEARQRS